MEIYVENIKCGGCANTITKNLSAIEGISDVVVDIEAGCIRFSGHEDLFDQVRNKLKSLGYPEVNSVEGLSKMAAKAKSFASCAVGKLDA